MDDYDEKLEYFYSIIKGAFNNKYFLKLSIFDHIRECNILYESVKSNPDNRTQLTDTLINELMDLYILLDLLYDVDKEFESRELIRMNRFVENINKNKESYK